MPARLQDVLQVFRLLVIDVAEHPLGEHFREPDDGVEGRPEPWDMFARNSDLC
jgi:hypothetical protein